MHIFCTFLLQKRRETRWYLPNCPICCKIGATVNLVKSPMISGSPGTCPPFLHSSQILSVTPALAALSAHSLLEGVTVASQESLVSLWVVLLAIAGHKWIIAMSLGVTLAQKKLRVCLIIKLETHISTCSLLIVTFKLYLCWKNCTVSASSTHLAPVLSDIVFIPCKDPFSMFHLIFYIGRNAFYQAFWDKIRNRFLFLKWLFLSDQSNAVQVKLKFVVKESNYHYGPGR